MRTERLNEVVAIKKQQRSAELLRKSVSLIVLALGSCL